MIKASLHQIQSSILNNLKVFKRSEIPPKSYGSRHLFSSFLVCHWQNFFVPHLKSLTIIITIHCGLKSVSYAKMPLFFMHSAETSSKFLNSRLLYEINVFQVILKVLVVYMKLFSCLTHYIWKWDIFCKICFGYMLNNSYFLIWKHCLRFSVNYDINATDHVYSYVEKWMKAILL